MIIEDIVEMTKLRWYSSMPTSLHIIIIIIIIIIMMVLIVGYLTVAILLQL